MDGLKHTKSDKAKQISRRAFVGGLGTAATAFTIVPRRVLGGPGYVPPSEKVNIAFIGVGSQGLRVMISFLRLPDVQGVAVSDPTRSMDNFPSWSRYEFRDSVRKLLGVSSGWEWLSPGQPIELPRSPAWSGVSGREPCQRIVEGLYAAQKRSGTYRGCNAYVDFREMLEKEKDVDAVVVCTTDNLHAPASIAAMRKGKHVYCQKPMTHTIAEARRMAEVARETGMATQVAVGCQASEDTRLLCEWVWGGAIGPVRQVHNWSARPFWPQGLDRPKETHPVPEGMDWNLWLGPAPERPFNRAYVPFVWRAWWDFGTNALGDVACYSFDTIFRVMKLESPTSVETSSTERHDDTYPGAMLLHANFPARGEMPPVRLTWYDGGLRPPRPAELDANKELEEEGLLLVGDKGTILAGRNGPNPRLIPEAKMKAFQPPPKTLPRSPGNEREWLDACKGSKTKPGANFEFSYRITETLALGNISARTGQRLIWDRTNLKVTNMASAEKLITPEHRPGWLV
jgi:predicted dehydrogenase